MTNPNDDATLAESHPTSEQLEQFANGALHSQQATWVEHHISQCETCCSLLDSTSNDKLIDLLRHSSTRSANASLRLVSGYEIESELGRGGMGVVYRAIQPSLRRQVALKMIAHGVHAGPQELIRFRREAEATAALRHPCIAQVYDVGEIDGRPYIAMELVNGCTLSEHLSKRPLKFDEATNLLMKICHAVEHAHANGIVHRDLKPQNILIEHDGHGVADVSDLRPKIVDFGLAKCMDSSATVTATGVIVGTPSYMSPEQASGKNEDVDAASDIYSMGAVLYEALVGRPPFKGASPIETLEQVRTAEPVRPSLLRPGLPKDLETICLKCLEKLPSDRYLTAASLLKDLERFKEGRPILARPAGLANRAWKWTKRYPALAALFGVILMLIASMVVLGVIYNNSLRLALRDAKTEQDRADGNFQIAFQAVEQMLDRVGFAQLADTPEMESVREQLLADSVNFYSKLLENQPRTDVDSRRQYYGAMARLGKIQWTLGENASALKNLQQAIELQRQLLAEDPQWNAVRHELAISHINKGVVSNDAQEFRNAIELLQDIRESYPECKRDLAQATNNLANTTESAEEKERLHRSALKLREELLLVSPTDRALRYGVGETQHNLGFLYSTTGRIAEAESAYRTALKSFETLVAEQDSVTDYRTALAETITHLAALIYSTGRSDEALGLVDEATAIRRILAARFPNVPRLREAVIRGLLNRAAFLIQSSKFSLASEASQEAVDMASDLIEEFPGTKYRYLEATCLTLLATALSGEPKMEEARSAFERANVAYDELLKLEPTNPDYLTEAGVQFMNFSNVLREEDPEQAATFNDRSIHLLEQAVERFPKRTDFQSYLFNAHGARATTYDVLGKYREAIVSWDRALQLAPRERRIQIGLLRAFSLSRSGEHSQAAEAIREFLRDEGIDAGSLYNMACIFGLADKASRELMQKSDSPKIEHEYADLSLELLNRESSLEFLRIPTNRQQLMVDPDLETVRSHPSFQKLVEKLDQAIN